jgi:type II secretory pathway pseudopilin PulG
MKFKKTLLSYSKINILRTKPGITLVELLVATAIMSIAVSLIFGIYLYSTKTFKEANINSKNQFEVRMAADFITKELRYAASAEVLNSSPAPNTNYYDIYIQNKIGPIVFNKKGVPTVPSGLNNVTDFTLTFSYTNNTINFTVGKAGTTKYNITSKVVLLNIPAGTSLNFTDTSIGIRYARQP